MLQELNQETIDLIAKLEQTNVEDWTADDIKKYVFAMYEYRKKAAANIAEQSEEIIQKDTRIDELNTKLNELEAAKNKETESVKYWIERYSEMAEANNTFKEELNSLIVLATAIAK